MTSTNKQSAVQSAIDWINFRKSLGVSSVKRVEIQVAVEVAGGLQIVVLDKEDLETIAQAVGGTYVTKSGGKSKIIL
jgi:acyl carrier protein